MNLWRRLIHRGDPRIPVTFAGIDAATAARKQAERRWTHVHKVAAELREERARNGFADRVHHALEGR